MMRRVAWAALLLSGLVACTGTSSPQPPRLLFVTHGTGPYLAALVEDDLAAQPRFSYLADSEVTLPGEPLAMDVTDRAGARDRVVLLLETGSHAYSAAWFDVEGIDPDAVTALAPDVLALGPLLAPELDDPNDLCLKDMQVGRTGELLALLNVPADCSGSIASPSILLLDTSDSTVTTLAATVPLLESGLYVRQGDSATGDELYWLEGGAGQAIIEGYRLPDGPALGDSGRFAAGSDLPVPLQLTFTAGSFAALQPGRLHLYGDAATSLALSPSTAGSLIADPFGDELQALLVLHDGSSPSLFVHENGGDANPTEVELPGSVAHGSVDPLQMWVYFTRPGGLVLVDLIEVLDEAAADPKGVRHTIGGLGEAGFITWLEGVLPPAP